MNTPAHNKHRPSWDEYFMDVARLAAKRSVCARLGVGCAIVLKNRIIAMGYNGFLPGAPHVSIVRDNHEMATVHAEQNAIADAAKRGVSVNGSTAYVTHYPCIHCAKLLLAAGITTIVFDEHYHDDPLIKGIVDDAGATLVQFKHTGIEA